MYVLGDVRYEERPDPGKMLDMVLPFAPLAEGYRAMDERRAIKVLLHP
jgi:threonine dehydrogenase-like Zn-dependent dehydrogenase